jgi:hypothetical protein
MQQTLFILLFLSVYGNAQVIKDTVLGKPKFVKEYVVFLNDSGPFTFMKGDDEYGHAIIMVPKILRKSMRTTWFETDFCRYINNETYYDKNRNITKEIWYYKSGRIVDDYDYIYDNLNRLITERSKNDYSEDISNYFYEKDSKTIKFRESVYRRKNDPIEKFITNFETVKPLLITKFDTITKTDSIFILTNDIWKKKGESYGKWKDSVYHKRLSRVRIYDHKYRIIEDKKFDYENDFQNKIVLQTHLNLEYDEYGNIIKQSYFSDGYYHAYIVSNNGKIIKEEKTDSGSKTSTTVYTYTKDQKLERKVVYYDNKVPSDINFEYNGNYIVKLYYLNKFGREEEDIKPTVVTFKYTFDKHKNWTEIIKNVDGKDLYKWVREIKYYE